MAVFTFDSSTKEKIKKAIKPSNNKPTNHIFMCGCDSQCDGCNGCTGCATYGSYKDGWHDLYTGRILDERKVG